MISHTHIGTSDLDAAVGFYDPVLGRLGLERKFVDPDRGWAGWKCPISVRPLFLVGVPEDGAPHIAGNGQMVALVAHDRSTVDSCHEAALAAGGTDSGKPGLRLAYHPDYYGAYFRDLDCNKICICCHDPEPKL